MTYIDKIPLYFSKKELMKILDNKPILFKRFSSQQPVKSHLMIQKVTKQKIKKFKKEEWYEAPGFIAGDLTPKIPKKINKYIEKSGYFVESFDKIGTFGNEIYSLKFPKYYKKIICTDPANTTEWYLITSNIDIVDEFNEEDITHLPMLISNASKIQVIPPNDIDIYLNAMEKVRPDFASQIRLYLEVN